MCIVRFIKNNIYGKVNLDPSLRSEFNKAFGDKVEDFISLPKHDLFITKLPAEGRGLQHIGISLTKKGKAISTFSIPDSPEKVMTLISKIRTITNKYGKIDFFRKLNEKGL